MHLESQSIPKSDKKLHNFKDTGTKNPPLAFHNEPEMSYYRGSLQQADSSKGS